MKNAASSPGAPSIAPLDGITVLELSQIMAGPVCGLLLSDMGADVIKVEKFPNGDDARGYSRPGDLGLSPAFVMLNRGKRSVALDLRHPAGREALLKLARSADVITENFRVGAMERLGLGYEELKAVNPQLIYCGISGYGRTGPMAQQGGFDLILQAFSGIISVTGTEDGTMVKPGISVGDVNAGRIGAILKSEAYEPQAFGWPLARGYGANGDHLSSPLHRGRAGQNFRYPKPIQPEH